MLAAAGNFQHSNNTALKEYYWPPVDSCHAVVRCTAIVSTHALVRQFIACTGSSTYAGGPLVIRLFHEVLKFDNVGKYFVSVICPVLPSATSSGCC